MILLIMRVRQMRGTDTADFCHYRRIFSRRVSKKRPVCASSTVDDVINRSRAQAKTRLYVPMLHSRFMFKLDGRYYIIFSDDEAPPPAQCATNWHIGICEARYFPSLALRYLAEYRSFSIKNSIVSRVPPQNPPQNTFLLNNFLLFQPNGF